jgi:shikimate kinase
MDFSSDQGEVFSAGGSSPSGGDDHARLEQQETLVYLLDRCDKLVSGLGTEDLPEKRRKSMESEIAEMTALIAARSLLRN